MMIPPLPNFWCNWVYSISFNPAALLKGKENTKKAEEELQQQKHESLTAIMQAFNFGFLTSDFYEFKISQSMNYIYFIN